MKREWFKETIVLKNGLEIEINSQVKKQDTTGGKIVLTFPNEKKLLNGNITESQKEITFKTDDILYVTKKKTIARSINHANDFKDLDVDLDKLSYLNRKARDKFLTKNEHGFWEPKKEN